jgi:hypothetical protein
MRGLSMSKERASNFAAAAGLLLAAPVVIVPGSAIIMMIWARWAFYQRHPDYVQHSAPTVSRAISDPFIGEPFAAVILAVACVMALALVPLCNAYLATIRLRTEGNPAARASLRRLMYVFMAVQACGTAGMVVCTQVTFRQDHDIHMVGSYFFFVFQAIAILLSGIVATRLVRLPSREGCPYLRLESTYSRIRRYLAFVTAGFAVFYLVLFVIKGFDLPIPEYDVYNFYTIHEIVTISAYIFHFMLYAPEVFRMTRSLVSTGSWRLEARTMA